jgi:hypothetical protein
MYTGHQVIRSLIHLAIKKYFCTDTNLTSYS